ncbi:MAG: GNAT family N-acetyltransferase [Planctomycetaceae bacterium]
MFETAAALSSECWEDQLARLVTFLATIGQVDVGLVRGARHDEYCDTGYLLSMWVAPEARRQRVASNLIDAIVDWARAAGLSRLVLDVAEHNAPAIALYRWKGFVPNGTTSTLSPPREHVRETQMELRL